MRPSVQEGDGRVKIVFSRRGGLSYAEFRLYLEKLKSMTEEDIRIHWPVIDIDGIDAQDHSKRAGLQVADLNAASITSGLESDYYGNCELRYAQILKPLVYKRNDNYLSYGMKLYPGPERLSLNAQQGAFVQLFGGQIGENGRPPGP
ncbi:DUF3800 domain-containing protein [Roseicella frigidaeris]|nr:DUF3800 domain-containing protein [Roseicella frigidaeris]